MSESDGKPLKGILKTGDEPRKKRVGGISLAADEGHDAEQKEHRFEVVEGKDGAVVKDSEGRVIREDEVKKSRKSNKEHQMIHKVKPEDGISQEETTEEVPVEQKQSEPLPSPKRGEKEKKKKKGKFW
mmetsp:Transcript_11610/g.15448  ORF Transcript_11610/g.15448 Transcript_11610/m.15448 type:complete len:128 (-) Transcript_11610:299-682(-)|eukprot:CAMPEP_0201476770 /NCGR_PEP_ID=MMETSP0151_2-20130828/1908_1 /ASSEMBLY_ACC=CAM_ASM_000257 /TAXON_ID=200890 /ORGANISM="Paramoeba atlantica, Strain 621/1 / CCAP 1560/9" /LENGTH=127 /DNA_ID=CAMNT_0047857249 /DNA_START=150 /DNA_END=530 /DNA_ORIENTATION=-